MITYGKIKQQKMDYNQMNILKKDFKQTTLCEPLVSKWNF